MKRRKRIFWQRQEQEQVFARAALLQQDSQLTNIHALRVAQEDILPASRQRSLEHSSGIGATTLKRQFEAWKKENNVVAAEPEIVRHVEPEPMNAVDPTAEIPYAEWRPKTLFENAANEPSQKLPANAMDQLKISIENITPQIAEHWLNNLNPTNRALRPGTAEKYAADMREGNWTACDAPIIFYEDGALGSGQHRLWGIIDSNTTQQFVIWRNYPRAAARNMDTGAKRSLVDNARISGDTTQLNTQIIAIAQVIELGKRPNEGMSYSQKLAVVEKHYEAAVWVATHAKRARFLSGSSVLGAIGRAYYFETDRDRLQKFCEVLNKGFSEGAEDTAAISLRNYLLKLGADKISSTSNLMWQDVFLKTQNAIKYFMRRVPLKQIKNVADEAYRLQPKHSALQIDAAQKIVQFLKQQPENRIMWTDLVNQAFGNKKRELAQQALAELAAQKVVSLSMVKTSDKARKLATIIQLERDAVTL